MINKKQIENALDEFLTHARSGEGYPCKDHCWKCDALNYTQDMAEHIERSTKKGCFVNVRDETDDIPDSFCVIDIQDYESCDLANPITSKNTIKNKTECKFWREIK